MHFSSKALPLSLAAAALIALLSLPHCAAKSIAATAVPSSSSNGTNVMSSSLNDSSSKPTDMKTSFNALFTSAPAPAEHIVRRREAGECPVDLTDIHVTHMPCDIDLPGLNRYIGTLPNQCICAYNMRFLSEKEYRTFKILQLEAFFFGQYSERLKRFEIEPHDLKT